MQQLLRTKIRNGTILLPPRIRKQWKNKEVFIVPEKDRMIIQALEAEWDAYEEKLRRGKNKISTRIIEEAVRAAKKEGA